MVVDDGGGSAGVVVAGVALKFPAALSPESRSQQAGEIEFWLDAAGHAPVGPEVGSRTLKDILEGSCLQNRAVGKRVTSL